jgi:hypothetical protein
MRKRPNPRAIKAARAYTLAEAANIVGVSIGTVRAWVRAGLPIMKAQRPYLILGDALRTFLEARRKERKSPLGPDQLFCLTCKQGRKPMWMTVDCRPQTAHTARLEGFCEACEGPCNRIISRVKLDYFRAVFQIASKDGFQP